MYNNEEISKDDSGEGNFSFKERDDYDADYESE